MTKSEEYAIKRSFKPKGEKSCENCKIKFIIYNKSHFQTKKYCSRACKNKSKRQPIIKHNCLNCSTEFEKVSFTNIKFCSIDCRNKYMGQLRSDRMKNGAWPKPPRHTSKSMEKLRKTWQRKEFKRKKKLRDYIRNNLIYKNWRTAIFERDSYKCKECGNNGHLHAHHLKSFSQIMDEFLLLYSNLDPIKDIVGLIILALEYQPFWEIDNGITLCEPCHQKKHKNHVIRFDEK